MENNPDKSSEFTLDTIFAMHMRAMLDYLFAKDEVFEIRIFLKQKMERPNFWEGWGDILSGYFTDKLEAIKLVSGIDCHCMPEASYVTVNPCNPDLLGRANNRFKAARKTTKDKDIIKIERLLIDLDPVRLSGISSTNAEVHASVKLANAIHSDLQDEGWGDWLISMSGNGAHLIGNLKEPLENTPENVNKVSSFLSYIADKYSTSTSSGSPCVEIDGIMIGIDQKIFNPARIFKLYGTAARKGDRTEDRHWRRSHILHLPVKSNWIDVEKLNELPTISYSKEHQNTTQEIPIPKPNSDYLDVKRYLEHYGREVVKVILHNGATLYCLKECVFDSSHEDNDSSIVKAPNGALSYQCFHDSCLGHTWREARKIISGSASLESFMVRESRSAKYRERTLFYPEPDLHELASDDVPEEQIEQKGIIFNIHTSSDTSLDVDEIKRPVNLLEPPGYIKVLMEWITAVSFREQPLLALNGALAFCSVMLNQHFSFENTRANLYLISLARTAAGKEGPIHSLHKLWARFPDFITCHLGEEVSSGQAVMTSISKNPVCLYLFDEFGLELQKMFVAGAQSHLVQLKKILLKLFSKSNSIFVPLEKADSDISKMVPVEFPFVSLLCSSTPEAFYKALQSENVRDGFLNRFLFLESHDLGVRNTCDHDIEIPEPIHEWLEYIEELKIKYSSRPDNPICVHTSEPAKQLLIEMWEDLDKKLVHAQLGSFYGRTAENAKKLAMICAVSRKSLEINEYDMQWAIDFAYYSTRMMIKSVRDNMADTELQKWMNRILEFIKSGKKKGKTMGQLRRHPSPVRGLESKILDEAIAILLNARDIRSVTFSAGRRGGKSRDAYVAKEYLKNRKSKSLNSPGKEVMYSNVQQSVHNLKEEYEVLKES